MGATEQPRAGRAERRIGVVENHTDLVVSALKEMLEPRPHLKVVAGAITVPALLEQTTDLDLVVLDLQGLQGDPTPQENVDALRAAGIRNVLAFTVGERPALIREAERAGVLGVVLKDEVAEVIVEAIGSAAEGQVVMSTEGAAALDADPALPELTKREQQVLSLYAAGETAPDIAKLLQVQPDTVYQHVKSIKAKYTAVGRPVPDKTTLRGYARKDGWAPKPW
ncbi:LuxR C-terminal-related transcriptional regulator [Nocardia inohanensis]|uniref:LuxR C-terminal-related transcriptional regulator n=1 Tax=Nocardia inohanensis TaxID=209246 RepID=UPI00082D5AA0|nr:response regulator transcription factor [Nocardia inohanensis]